MTADEALHPESAPRNPEPGLYLATDVLLRSLKGGPRPAVEVVREALAEGIRERTLERAKKEARVVSELKYQAAERQWVWKLVQPYPTDLPELPQYW